MGLKINKDIHTGIELDDMYFRIDKIEFNDYDFQVVATGYASEQAYRDGALPISQPRAYTLQNYDRDTLMNSNIFIFAYESLKTAQAFEEADNVFEGNQEEEYEQIEELETGGLED